MKRPAIFFDRDNTLIACDGFLDDPSKLVLVDGAADAVARARAMGYSTVIVSNQSGVARGMFDEQTVHDINQRLQQLLLAENTQAVIDRHEFCPFHPDGTVEAYRQESPRRKPAPGMLLDAAEALALDLTRSWTIGDSARDVQAGQAAGTRTVLVTLPGLAASPATASNDSVQPDARVSSLADALDFIANEPPREEEPAIESTDAADTAPAEVVETTEADIEEPQSPVEAPVDEAVVEPATEVEDVEDTVVAPEPLPQIAPPAPAARSAPQARPATSATAPRETPAVAPPPAPLEYLTREILQELRRNRDQSHNDFHVGKLLAGILQVLVVGVLFFAYVNRADALNVTNLLLLAIVFQVASFTLMIMGKSK